MTQTDAPAGSHRRRTEHELWLGMQAAYEHYRSASEALDALTSDVTGVIPIRHSSLESHRAAKERQVAFEEYIEARLLFSESFLTKDTSPPEGLGISKQQALQPHTRRSGAASRSGFKWRLFLWGALAAALGTMTLSSPQLIRERNHALAGSEAKNPAPDPIDVRARRMSAGNAIRQNAGIPERQRIGDSHGASQKQAAPQVKPRKAPSKNHEGWGKSIKRRQDRVRVRDRQPRDYYQFTLSPSPRYQRAGPVRLSVTRLDAGHKSFDLSILSDNSRLDKKHVRLYERIWVQLDDGGRGVELVASGIGNTHVHGYVSELKRKKPESAGSEPRRKPNSSHPVADLASE